MKVGLVYDPIYTRHDTGQHVESALRVEGVMALLEKSGVRQQLVILQPEPAPLEEIALVHSAEYISQVEKVAQAGGGWLDSDTVMSPASYEVALYAAGGVIKATQAVMRTEVDTAFALVRPPGHHATRSAAMGFCLFNNIAIAAKHAMKNYPLERILIVDFDVHHGNATQDTFYNDPGVLYFSLHQYPFYPGTGGIDETGIGEGEGSTVNVPLPAGCGDREYLKVFQEILYPVARRFRPRIILVSAGYDAHWADQMSQMQVSTAGFARMVELIQQMASEMCDGRSVFALEGGYHIPALAHSVKATLEVLLGKNRVDDPLGKPASGKEIAGFEGIIREVKRVHDL